MSSENSTIKPSVFFRELGDDATAEGLTDADRRRARTKSFYRQLRSDLGQGPLAVNAARRLLAYDKTWIKKMEQRRIYKPPKWKGQQKPRQLDDHIFNMQPSALAQNLRAVYKDDYKGAMGAITLYKNRMGKNLLSPDRNRLDQAKEALRKLYKKDDNESKGNEAPDSAKPRSKDEPADVRDASGKAPIGSRPTTRTV